MKIGLIGKIVCIKRGGIGYKVIGCIGEIGFIGAEVKGTLNSKQSTLNIEL
jgi:hypothetical protein